MRVAFATNYPPAPAVSGAPIRSQHLARALAERAEVVLYCKAPRGYLDAFEGHADLDAFAAVRVLPLDARALEAPNPQFSTSMEQWDMAEHPAWAPLRHDHRARPFDALVCEQIFTAGAARALPGVPVIIGEHNVESRVLEHIAEPRALVTGDYRVSLAEARAHEARVWSAAALVTCVSQADADYVRAWRDGPTVVVPNGVDIDRIAFTPPSRRRGDEVLFIGSFFWRPNAEAAAFLAREVMPRVWRRRPAARLTLCGAAPPPDVCSLARPGICVTGTVPSVRPHLARAAVYANALFAGEGSSLKALEPLAAGLPLVSTAVGVRGHGLEPATHYARAETADEFADAIEVALSDREALDAVAARARAFVQAHDWRAIGGSFAARVLEVLS